ncbi:DUF6603 domain-containing protein [Actinokineospora bangkokensis]|uniref:DUF6603 domain-containing protein n=1 Tax=Actinokineospora bangkokensis TaxID=1193682 RepID=A0A1Q9LLJ0_9PSEU|nr:DUF6603 domain-containing protein [Actinokineospora bangkokensis]OLR92890.1 hypothetical protein BJP25_18100 [Actinokineospora bangkokensis]
MSAPVPGNAQAALVREVEALLRPLVLAAGDQWHLDALLEALGWDPTALPGTGADLSGWLTDVTTAVGGITDLVEHPPQSLDDLGRALATAAAAFRAVRQLPRSLAALDAQALAQDVLDHLVISYLVRHHVVLHNVLVLLGVVVPAADLPATPGIVVDGAAVRLPRARSTIRPERLVQLLTDPVGAIKAEYGGLDLSTEATADAVAAKLLPRLGALLRSLGVDVLVGLGDTTDSGLDATSVRLGNRMLTLAKHLDAGEVQADLQLTAALGSGQTGGLGVVLVPSGAVRVDQVLGDWALTADLGAAGPGVAIGAGGVTLATDDSGHVTLRVELHRAEGAAPLRLGSATGTRLEVADPRVWVGAELDPPDGAEPDPAKQVDVEVGAVARKAAIVIAAGDGDGFLKQVLPAEGLRAEFALGLIWSRRSGLRFEGSAGLDATLPVHVRLGPLEVRDIGLALVADTTGARLAVTGTAAVALGPVKATVEKVGLAGTLKPAANRDGNLGPIDAGVAFEPPKGVAIAVDAGVVTGGGYLFADRGAGQYAGAVALQFKALALQAVGILSTRMPDGSDGFSLLLIVSAKFTPVQLGFGFTLNGVGGLIGVNRSIDTEALRSGLRTGSLDSVLFPEDPVGRAKELVTTLGGVFPAVRGRHVVGPMARIGWGTPTLVTLDVAVLLELPSPVRLALLGKLHMALPTEKQAVVVVNVDVLGTIDFDRGEAAVDASLRDSRIAAFPLTGDIALRAKWSGTPSFALSAGGFHPRFQPPAGFPALRRLGISLLTGDNPRLRLEAYLALTSNTAQFGAKLELYAAALGFSVEGVLGFDALVRFDPFGFEVDVAGMLAVKRGTRSLMSVRAELALSGPRPWHARGLAKFEVLFFDVEISFDRTFGPSAPPRQLPPAVVVVERVEAALADPRNWTAQLPRTGRSPVTVRQIPVPAGVLLVHPLGTVSVTQRVAPLGITLDKFGQAPVSGPRRVDITSVRYRTTPTSATRTLSTVETRDHFAPAEFRDLTDDERLSRPSFESLQAGRTTQGATAIARDRGALVEAPVDDFDETIVDAPAASTPATLRAATRRVPGAQAAPSLLARAAVGPAALAATRRTGSGRFATAARPLDLLDTAYALDTEPAQPAQPAQGAGFTAARATGRRLTFTEADDLRRAAEAAAPPAPFTTQARPPAGASQTTGLRAAAAPAAAPARRARIVAVPAGATR